MKSHHYIISFDPRDGPDNGLTVDRAQELGEKFCAEHFPGHQALVCTHPDGHNHSGNIHVHIVINSLRIEEVPFLPYMDRPADTKAGCKHRCTDAALRYFKSEVMEMCHREGLYQIDLLNGSKNRVTDREYWAQKKGQAALDRQNAPMIAGGITPRQTKFETNKEKLRQTIRAALSAAASFEDFSSLLLREGVAVKESRGRLSPTSRRTGQSPLPPGSWATTLTAPLSLPFWSRTPPEPQKRPRLYPAPRPLSKTNCGQTEPPEPPRMCSGLWTLSRRKPRGKAGAMNAGRPCTTSNRWPRR